MDDPKLRDLVNIKSDTVTLPSNILMIPIELQAALRDILPAVASDYRAGHFSGYLDSSVEVFFGGNPPEQFNFDDFACRVEVAWKSMLEERRFEVSMLDIYENCPDPTSYDFVARFNEQSAYLAIKNPSRNQEKIKRYLHPFVSAEIIKDELYI